MSRIEKPGKVLLTLREAAKKLGVSDELLVDLVFVHPPIIDIKLVGRAPRVYASQLTELRDRWVVLTMELIQRNPPLLGFALGSVKSAGVGEGSKIDVAGLRQIITNDALAGRG